LALESGRPVAHVADDLGIARETLRKAVRLALSGRREVQLARRELCGCDLGWIADAAMYRVKTGAAQMLHS
jgi:transposase-like protein